MGRSTKLGKTRLDKYYHLAKEQGYRSRAAFKLIQLNKKYNFLSNARVAIDLCAAPGGWLQVLAKEMPVGSKIIGLDLDTIRPIRGVTTFQQDITTQQCRQVLKRELVDWKVDVVVHDGAPNVGGAWAKDAYGQNELVLHSLKLATEFLIEKGWFVTKVFRSADYNALLWVFNQLFEKVEATKPLASRNTSAEIFVVAQGYRAPDKIDARMLDPEYVFKQVDKPQKAVDVLHAKSGKRKRNRDGYDDAKGMTQHRSFDVNEWIKSAEPVRVLSEYQSFTWGKDTDSQALKRHPTTTEEIKACLKDLQVLSKPDFRSLLKWREGIVKHRRRLAGEDVEEASAHLKKKINAKDEKSDEEEDEGIAQDKWLLRHLERKKKEKKRQKKKAAAKAAKERARLAMGMENIAVDIIDNDNELFSLDTIRRKSDLKAIADVELGRGKTELLESEEEEVYSGPLPPSMRNLMEIDDKTVLTAADHDEAMNDEFEMQYQEFKRRRDARIKSKPVLTGLAGGGAKGRRKREAATLEALFEAETGNRSKYQNLLAGKNDDGKAIDEDEESDSDSEIDQEDQNPLLQTSCFVGQTPASRANRWFSNSLFEGLGNDSDNDDSMLGKRKSDQGEAARIESELAALPKSAREKRKAALKRAAERKSKRDEAREKRDAAGFSVIESVKDDVIDKTISGPTVEEESEMTRAAKRKRREALKEEEEEARKKAHEAMIKAGMGNKISKETIQARLNAYDSDSEEEEANPKKRLKIGGFEIDHGKVSFEKKKALEELDDMEVGSTAHARTIALGAMMLKHSSAKDLLDSSYNRFAFDDPEDLPSWFLDDQQKYNQAIIPVSSEMVRRVKQQYSDLTAKPIKKVAEARARKRFKAAQKMRKAKQAATSIINNDEMGTVSKINAIKKAMKKAEIKKPGKCYVVNGKSGSKAGSRGSKYATRVVDKRMKSDKRAAKRLQSGKYKTKNKGNSQRRKTKHKRRR
eukprot:g1477.t1